MSTYIDAISAIRMLTSDQKAIFRAISDAWTAKDIAFGISGGLTIGQGDAYSDLDFFFSAESGTTLETAVALARDVAPVLFEYASNDLFMKNSAILYFDLGDTVVKVDITALGTSDDLPAKARVCHDPLGVFAARGPNAASLDHEVLAKKFAGWMWIIHGRIERGEVLSAMRSIDFCRELVVLPILLDMLALPQSGHRRLEQLLPAQWLCPINDTVPLGLDKRELRRAADALLHLFFQVAEASDGRISRSGLHVVARTRDIIDRNGGFARAA